MGKTYTVNGVQVSYDVFHQIMDEGANPDNFHDLRNIDAPDIPQIHKSRYAEDLKYLGASKTFWTPRRRMLQSIEWKEKQAAGKKQARLGKRQSKMDAWGEQRKSDNEYQAHLDLMHRSESERTSNQQEEGRKSAIGMTVIIGGGFLLMCLLFVAIVYLNHRAG